MTLLLLLAAATAGVLDQARDIRRAGDLAAAAELLDTLHPLVEPDEEAGWYLERGIVEELAWRPEAAQAYFEEAVARGGEVAAEARYHLVTVLSEQGRHADARIVLRALQGTRGLNPDFVPVLRVHEGVLDVHQGRPRRGEAHVRAGLRAIDDADRFAWAIGRGRFTLLDLAADKAESLPLSGRQARVTRNLRARVKALKVAEDQLYAVIETDEPEWITDSLLRMGDTWAALGEALVSSPPPAGLTPAQAEVYRIEIARKAEGPFTRAWTYYDRGADLAARVGWQAPTVDVLRARRDALAPQVPASGVAATGAAPESVSPEAAR